MMAMYTCFEAMFDICFLFHVSLLIFKDYKRDM
jgi:hypothetical protein